MTISPEMVRMPLSIRSPRAEFADGVRFRFRAWATLKLGDIAAKPFLRAYNLMLLTTTLFHDSWLGWMVAVSVVMFIASLLAVPAIIIRLPTDYFSHSRRHPSRLAGRGSTVFYTWMILKNFSGIVFFFMGIAMLVLPGQGILSILVGLSLIDFPGKYRLERFIVCRKPVMKSINWIRRKADQPELESNL